MPNRPRTTSERVVALRSRRLAAGWRRITLLLRPETAAALDQLRPIHGSDTASIEAALAIATRRQKNLAKPENTA